MPTLWRETARGDGVTAPKPSDAAREAAEEIVTERMASDLLFAFFGDPPTPQAVQKQRAQMVADGAASIQRAIDSETAALREDLDKLCEAVRDGAWISAALIARRLTGRPGR